MIRHFENITSLLEIGNFRYYLIVAKRNFLNIFIISLLIGFLAILVSLNIEKQFISTATIVIAPDENKIISIEEAYSIDSQQNRINNQIAILKSDEVIDYIVNDSKNQIEFSNLYSAVKGNIIDRLFKKKIEFNKEFLISIFRDNFKVKNISRSDVLQLSFVSTDPKISQLALKNIIDSYQRYEIDSKIQITTYANTKITERLSEITKQMDISEQKLSEYKKANKLVDTGNVKELKIKEIQSISSRILDANQSLQEQQSDLLAIKVAEGDTDALLAIKDLNNRDEIININNSLSANENNIESLLLIYQEKHPKVKQAYDQNVSLENQLKKILNETIEKKAFELGNLQTFIKLQESALEKATSELQDIEEKEAGMMKYVREVESSRKLYETFLQRVKETNESQNLQVSKLKIIETPTFNPQQISPNILQNFLFAFLLSAFTVYFLVYYKEINSAIITTPDILNKIDIDQIGIIPKVQDLKRGYHLLQYFLEEPNSTFSESIRSVRTIIESKYKKNKTYLITSSNPSEGKTTFSFNLALSLEKTNKVLFIEADIRRPSVLNGFYKIDKQLLGLGDLISNNATINECISKVPGTNLEIITSGEKRFDLSDIVTKEQITKFFDLLKLNYDYLIVDSPPIQPVSDTLILVQASDYNFFVLRSEQSRNAAFLSSLKKIQSVNSKINGTIINDLDISKDSYYNYYYNYTSYNYDYGYTNKKN
jgi:capsular exopolysaccharide synthesis family protein